jgi:uncharacterized membrane protein YeaQ/YmgE (transglycosylase-associated protein family)
VSKVTRHTISLAMVGILVATAAVLFALLTTAAQHLMVRPYAVTTELFAGLVCSGLFFGGIIGAVAGWLTRGGWIGRLVGGAVGMFVGAVALPVLSVPLEQTAAAWITAAVGSLLILALGILVKLTDRGEGAK